MLGKTSRYALHVLGYLAASEPGLVSGKQIAEATGIPGNYLCKILNQLRKSGFVEAQRGWHGGFRLHPAARRRSVRQVLEVTGVRAGDTGRDCGFGFPRCDPSSPCPLHGHWERIRSEYEAMLDRTQVSDLAIPRDGSRRCHRRRADRSFGCSRHYRNQRQCSDSGVHGCGPHGGS